MKKTISRMLTLFLAFTVLICCVGCNSEEAQQELEKKVHEALYGGWVYYDSDLNARYTYLFEYGTIEQDLRIVDDEGVEHNLSLGNSFSVRYNVISENEIEIYSTMTGKEVTGDKITFEKPDDDTLILDGVTYIRYEKWIETQPET